MKGKYRQFWDGVGPGDLFPASPTQILSNLYHYLLHFTLFFPLPVLASLFFSSLSPSTPTTSFFSSSSLLTLCIGSGVLAVMWLFVRTQLPVFAIGRCFFERALVSRVTGNGGTTSLFSAAASPPPPFCIALSWSLSVSPTGCGRSGSPRARHTQTVTVAVQLFLFSLFSFFIGQQAVTETIRLQEVSETNGLVCWDLAVFLPRSLHFLFVSFLVEHIASLVSSCTDNIQSKWKSPGRITHWSNNYSYKVSLCLCISHHGQHHLTCSLLICSPRLSDDIIQKAFSAQV